VPKPVCDVLGLKPHDLVDFKVAADGTVMLTRVPEDGEAERNARRLRIRAALDAIRGKLPTRTA
jgi:bifunctional DNA-binding transcriptional regulator/antitoxin component of YhaV-PrlF toxin-antitoxin module